MLRIILFVLTVLIGIFQIIIYKEYYDLGFREDSYKYLGNADLICICLVGLFGIDCISSLLLLCIKKDKSFFFWNLTILSCFVVCHSLLPPVEQMIAIGLRDRAVKDNVLLDLRRFAREFSDFSSPGSPSGSPFVKELTRQELNKTDLIDNYRFLHWIKASDGDGPAYVKNQDGVIDIRWGSAFSGHWGFSIKADGGSITLPMFQKYKALYLSRDSYVIYEP